MTLRKIVITSLIRRESTWELLLWLEAPMAVILRPTSFLRFLRPQTPKNRSHNEQKVKHNVKISYIFGENYENRKNRKIALLFLILTGFWFCKKKMKIWGSSDYLEVMACQKNNFCAF